jgi:hypothetical protein
MKTRIASRSAILLSTIMSACGLVQLETDNEISRWIESKVQFGTGAFLDLTEINDFRWDRLYFFPPYSTDEEIKAALGTAWPVMGHSRVHMLEGFTLVVFVLDGNVVRAHDHERTKGDFSELYRREGYARSEAKFTVLPEGSEKWPRVLLLKELSNCSMNPTAVSCHGSGSQDPGRPWPRGRQAGPAPGHPAGYAER